MTTLASLLTLRVDFRDPDAAARISPEAASAYLAAHGWRPVLDTTSFRVWDRGDGSIDQALVPRSASYPDHGHSMTMLLGKLAAFEDRSVLAVYAEMTGAT